MYSLKKNGNSAGKITPGLPLLTLIILLFLPQCAKAQEAGMTLGSTSSSFTEDRSVLMNPERGWYIARGTDEAAADEFAEFKKRNVTTVMLEANLGNYIDKALDSQKLLEIERAFLLARGAGLSVIFRAAYDFNGRSNPEPPDIKIILNHIEQLKPIFEKHEDILFNVQAGFLGAWGEWHHSHYGDPRSPDDPPYVQYQRQVADALLAAVPKSVSVALRRPEYIRNIADDSKELTGRELGKHDPVTQEEAFGSSKIARLSFHNDALMSDDSDMDTYYNDLDLQPREKELQWASMQTRYTPMVAETNLVSNYNNTETAIPLLDRINIQSLNIEYHPRVLRKWKTSQHGGMNAFDYIGMMLGYRFVLKRADLSELADSKLRLDLDLVNAGFSRLLKEKKFELVLRNPGQTYRAVIAEDARFWNKNEPVKRSYLFQLPKDLKPGSWEVYLGLSSTYDTLANVPAYSVRFSNKDTWVPALGLNKIGTIKLVKGGESGDGQEFIQITP